ncbi:MAG: hypothetical protein GF364_02840 [Candidatus Lokiarchaeota archaeon]|nr:hypothetical protein [Candidatus Lokiarchaeota archaeon]
MKNTRLKSMFFIAILIYSTIGMNIQVLNSINNSNDYNAHIDVFAQNYTENVTSDVEGISLEIHQAYHDEIVKEINNTDNSYVIPAPHDENFNTSSVQLELENIKAHNYTKSIEDSPYSRVQSSAIDNSLHLLTSFTTKVDCYLNNVSFELEKTGTSDRSITLLVYNATWDSDLGIYVPYDKDKPINDTHSIVVSTGNGWRTITDVNLFLDNDRTEGNTWFIGFELEAGPQFFVWWRYVGDDTLTAPFSQSDYINETNSVTWTGTEWDFAYDWFDTSVTIDLCSKVGLDLLENDVAPSEIGLKVNNSAIINNTNDPAKNKGYWTSNNIINGSDGELNFTFESDWEVFDFEVNETQVNYTKNYFSVDTNFTAKTGNDIYWNSSIEITEFDNRLDNNTITFTTPSSWDILDVKNNTESKSYSSVPDILFTDVVVTSDATNGNWTLLTYSTNLIDDFKIGRYGVESYTAYSNETVTINATFAENMNGMVNLTIYNPDTLNDEINYTIEKPISNIDYIDLGTWNCDTNITDIGYYRVRIWWYNDTDAAIMDKLLYIGWAASLDVRPFNDIEKYSNDPIFNISLIYEEDFTDTNITGATIGYDLQLGSGWQTDSTQSNPDETYNISVDPSLYPTIGQYNIPITINKTGYYNYSIIYTLNIVNGTQIQTFEQQNILEVIRGSNASYYFNYNETYDEAAIDLALISEISVNDNFSWSYSETIGGNYSVTLNTSKIDVGDYECSFIISKIGYETQDINFIITVTKPSTELLLLSQPDPVWRLSGKNSTVSFALNDTDNQELVSDMPACNVTILNGSNPTEQWNVGTFNYHVWEVGNGEYKVNISISGLDAGYYSVIINASYTPNYKSSELNVEFYVQGNRTIFTLVNVKQYEDFGLNVLDDNSYGVYEKAEGFIIEFRLNDTNDDNELITDEIVSSFEIVTTLNDTANSILSNNIQFDDTRNVFSGVVSIPNTLPIDVYEVEVKIIIFNYENTTYTMKLSVLEEPGIPEQILYLILASIVAVVAVIGIQKGIIAPRKRKYQEEVLNTASIFEDAINMRHIIIIYKETGTCVYFKSFGTEEIDPDLIGGFLTAAQSFAKESISASESLSEIKMGDNSLLISDGQFVRVTLVLGKPASQFLKSNLSRFILRFEAEYRSILQDWRGQLNVFKGTGKIVDAMLHTSVILPHKISTDIKARKQLKSSLAKSLLNIAKTFTAGKKELFFLGQIITEAKNKLKKKPQEILLGVNELINKKVFIPVDLSQYEQKSISEQEMKLLAQKVAELPNFTNEEKENLIRDLVEMNAI